MNFICSVSVKHEQKSIGYGVDNQPVEPYDLIVGWVVCFQLNCTWLSIDNVGTAWYPEHCSS